MKALISFIANLRSQENTCQFPAFDETISKDGAKKVCNNSDILYIIFY